ncbi:MAG: cytochrome C [Bdellovibrionota bacterium]
MKLRSLLLSVCTLALPVRAALADAAEDAKAAQERLDRGRYLASVSGCNDCHTPGFPQKGGAVPEQDWLIGVPVGNVGPWGTSYPSNLRLLVSSMTEDAFVARLRGGKFRPPMPGHVTRIMKEEDLKALYQFIHSLGPKGDPIPVALPPGVKPTTPWINMEPQAPKR